MNRKVKPATIVTDASAKTAAFEAALSTLRPFTSGYSMASDQRLKLRLLPDASTTRLDEALTALHGLVTRGHNVLFVRFEMDDAAAAAIAARVFDTPAESRDRIGVSDE